MDVSEIQPDIYQERSIHQFEPKLSHRSSKRQMQLKDILSSMIKETKPIGTKITKSCAIKNSILL